ncbi:hypothetical protein LshimejAT787_0100940 [Lyophyllum shimeji]|uniref:DUF6534 domain-containing protein n=1 Tax=Lyophyllum shimeji TaxID=47721 RepID=A0A9P3PD08_LYOSH|nr:hypothetical protein LshimejAT787_0100940 [Lyophyllum shimeji]
MPVEADTDALLSGPLFLGCIFNWALFGTLVVQQHDYFNAYRTSDGILIIFMVYLVFVLQIVETGFVTHSVWALLVLGWGKPILSLPIPWTAPGMPLLSSVVAGVMRMYFVSMIRSLKSSAITGTSCAVVTFLALFEFGTSVAILVQSISVPVFSILQPMYTMYLAGGVASDSLIAANMIFLLSKTSIPLRTHIIHYMAVFSVETGTLIATAAIAQLFLFLCLHSSFSHIATRFVISRLYANVLLAVLNRRPVPNPNPEQIDTGCTIPLHHLEESPMVTGALAVAIQAEPHASSLAHSSTEMGNVSSQDVSSVDPVDAQKAPEL